MQFKYNKAESKDKRRSLRKNQTEAEGILWSKISNKQCCGLKFFRQYSVGKYILDFYCPALRLAIELDGGQHNENQKEYDILRSKFLNSQNIKVLRF